MNRLATVLGRRYKFLPQLGFIFFSVDLIHLQVQKPASADLHNIKFIKDWGEVDPEFFPDSLTQARTSDIPQARISAHLSTQ
jgi:hypothetical protein